MIGDRAIKKALKAGEIVIEPFTEESLGTNSYDMRLGAWYWKQRESSYDTTITLGVDDAEAFWEGPYCATEEDVAYDGRAYITVPWGETILAHTQEVAGALLYYTTSMRARSSIARSGLSVCRCAGLGDVGFVNKWTMEISNHTQSDIRIPVGMRVAQLGFYYVGISDKVYTGKYGQTAWTPWDMLPKLTQDKDIRTTTQRLLDSNLLDMFDVA